MEPQKNSNRTVKLYITDFDGTLVDTIDANAYAYKKAFEEVMNKQLPIQMYKDNFGLRFDALMNKLGVKTDTDKLKIKELKKNYYPQFFNKLRLNKTLLQFFKNAKEKGYSTAIASTASRVNLIAVLKYFNIDTKLFDVIVCGDEVKSGKPDPEIYLYTLNKFGLTSKEAFIFEDSAVGIQAAENAGIMYSKVEHFA